MSSGSRKEPSSAGGFGSSPPKPWDDWTDETPIPVVVVCGPTASGKTRAALRLALMSEAEIICADSVQVYKGLDIGSAKPTSKEQAMAPHHLIDVAQPDDPMTAARYESLAREAARQIRNRGKAVILAGGTGLYIRAFVHGLMPAPSADPALRRELERLEERCGEGTLHQKLCQVDHEAAARLNPNDRVRIIRALEVFELTGAPISRLQRTHGFRASPYRVRYVALDPGVEALSVQIRDRVDWMLDNGLVEEVQALRRKGYGPELRPLRSPGYRQIFEVIERRMDLAQARESICTDHRRYAKRQRVWFRGVEGVVWYKDHDRLPYGELAGFLAPST